MNTVTPMYRSDTLVLDTALLSKNNVRVNDVRIVGNQVEIDYEIAETGDSLFDQKFLEGYRKIVGDTAIELICENLATLLCSANKPLNIATKLRLFGSSARNALFLGPKIGSKSDPLVRLD